MNMWHVVVAVSLFGCLTLTEIFAPDTDDKKEIEKLEKRVEELEKSKG